MFFIFYVLLLSVFPRFDHYLAFVLSILLRLLKIGLSLQELRINSIRTPMLTEGRLERTETNPMHFQRGSV